MRYQCLPGHLALRAAMEGCSLSPRGQGCGPGQPRQAGLSVRLVTLKQSASLEGVPVL